MEQKQSLGMSSLCNDFSGGINKYIYEKRKGVDLARSVLSENEIISHS